MRAAVHIENDQATSFSCRASGHQLNKHVILTNRSPRGHTASSHGVKLLRAGGAEAQEGAFNVLTQGSSAHTL
jgi:hypothetical protein